MAAAAVSEEKKAGFVPFLLEASGYRMQGLGMSLQVTPDLAEC